MIFWYDPYYEPLLWFMILNEVELILLIYAVMLTYVAVICKCTYVTSKDF